MSDQPEATAPSAASIHFCRLSIGILLKTLRLEQSLAAAAIRSSKMSHIRRLSASHSLFGAVLRFFDSTADRSAGGGSGSLRKARGCLIAVSALMLAAFATQHAMAQPRSSATSGRSAPASPPGGHQTEAIDLNEGKSAAELFQAGCAVCHQSPAGLAKGRSSNELIGFLRQHYTSSLQHAGALAGFLSGAGPGRGAPATATPGVAPNRQAPIDRPPSAIGRRSPADDDGDQPPSLLDRRRRPAEAPRPQDAARPEAGRPQENVRPEASRPPEREAPAKRKPAEKPERPAATARSPQTPAAPSGPHGTDAAPANEPAAAPAASPAPAAPPPAEDKPAAGPDIPL